MKALKIGLTIACLLMSLGCSTPQTVIEYQAVKIAPPSLLLADCPMPATLQNPATNLDLLQYAIGLKEALEACNQDKAALRKFYEEE